MDLSRLRLYLVADPDAVDGALTDAVAAAIQGGVTSVQLRVKGRPDRVIEDLAHAVGEICRRTSTLYLINDRVDVALAVGADGVHLGVDDLSIEAARRLSGAAFVIGYSPESDEQTTEAARQGANYLGVGPVFGTTSKLDAGPAIGLETLSRRAVISGIPTIGIGGITAANAGDVMASGASGIAVMGAILSSPTPQAAARDLDAATRACRT